MPVKPVVIGADHPVLRAWAKRVSLFGKELQRLIRDLYDTVVSLHGAGLAAPQLGATQAVCIAKVHGEFVPLVNPEILWCSEERVMGEEGCFSLPDVWLLVPRAREIIVRYQDERGRGQERALSDFDARVVQHEVDHLHGTLIVDYSAKPVERTGEVL
jgi:peptide deformylase